MHYRALITFFAFSMIYSFLLTGDSYLSLGNDTSVIGLFSFKDVYSEIFSGDPILSDSSFIYIPSHLLMLKTLEKVANSYLFSLKVILFFQVFLSLLANYVLIKGLFKKLSILQVILLSLLITMTFVMLPFGDFVGFAGVSTVTPRSTFGIFLPLIVLYYFSDRAINIFNRTIPNIIVLSFILGLLVNIHPQSGINVFAVIIIHWIIFRAKKLRDMNIIGLAIIIFCAASASFLLPYIFGKIFNPQEVLSNEYIEYLLQRGGNRRQMMWLLKLTFLPFSITFLLMTFVFKKEVYQNHASSEVFHLLKTLFVIGYIVDILSALLHGHVFLGSADIWARPFLRTERFVFYLVELLIVYFMVNGRELLTCDRREAEEYQHQN